MSKLDDKAAKPRYIETWDTKYHTTLILESTIESSLRDCEFAKGISPGMLHAFRHALKIVKKTPAKAWKPLPLIDRSNR